MQLESNFLEVGHARLSGLNGEQRDSLAHRSQEGDHAHKLPRKQNWQLPIQIRVVTTRPNIEENLVDLIGRASISDAVKSRG